MAQEGEAQSKAGEGTIDGAARDDSAPWFRMLVERIPKIAAYVDLVIVNDPGHSIPLYISPQIEDLLGYPLSDWLAEGELWLQILHPEDAARMHAPADLRAVPAGGGPDFEGQRARDRPVAGCPLRRAAPGESVGRGAGRRRGLVPRVPSVSRPSRRVMVAGESRHNLN